MAETLAQVRSGWLVPPTRSTEVAGTVMHLVQLAARQEPGVSSLSVAMVAWERKRWRRMTRDAASEGVY